MEGEEVRNAVLPDELVETIISMVPFPSIFKARCLSKSWLARLSSTSTSKDKAAALLAKRFQKLVSERSKSWGTFCPVLMGKEGDLVCYDGQSGNWRKLPPLNFLPDECHTRLGLHINGALLLAHDNFHDELYVANFLTCTWKELPSPPLTGTPYYTAIFAVIENTYKVVLLCQSDPYDADLIQIYDSRTDSWSIDDVGDRGYFDPGSTGLVSNGTYLGGVVYLLADNMPPNLWAFNVKQRMLEEHEFPFFGRSRRLGTTWYHLVACQSELLMIVSRNRNRRQFQKVLKVDLEASRLVQLARGPPSALTVGSIYEVPVSDSRSIYFGLGEDDNSILRYNKASGTWDCLPVPSTSSGDEKYTWVGSSFQPGLNPFAAV